MKTMRTSKRRGLGVTGGGAMLCLVATTAWADPPALQKPTKAIDSTTREIDKHIKDGQEAADGNRWDAARQEFLKAHELNPHSVRAVALLAQAELATGKNREAAEHLRLFLEQTDGIVPEDRQIAEKLLEEAKSKLAIILIKVDKPGANVLVDGWSIGISPIEKPVIVDMGLRRIEAETPSGRASVTVDVKARSTQTIDLILKATATKVITESQAWRAPVIYGCAALGAAGLLAGAGLFIGAEYHDAEAIDIGDKLNAQRKQGETFCPAASTDPLCVELTELQRRRDTFGWASLAGFVVGGAAAATTLAFWLTTPKKPASRNSEHAWVVVPTGQGVLITGTF